MHLTVVEPAKVSNLAGKCRKFATEAIERAAEQGRLVCLQGHESENGFELVFAVSVHRDQAETINQTGTLYREPAEYLEFLKRNTQ